MDLDQVAHELYGLEEPSQFVGVRDARSKEARGEDRALADAIKRLKRASTAAWVANVFVRRYPDEMAALAELGARLRDAQARGDGDSLRSLIPERRHLIAELARMAQNLATELGHPATPATMREVESTLDAALADEQATSAVASGLLVRALEHVGEAVDVAGATAIEVAVVPVAPRPLVPRPAPVTAPGTARVDGLREAEFALGAATAARVAAESRRAEAASMVSQLEDELSRARVVASEAARDLRDAQDAERRASQAVATAARRSQRGTGRVPAL